LIGIVGGLYILISTLINSPKNSLFGIGVTLVGFPVFWYLENGRKQSRATPTGRNQPRRK
jgi:APA family basic amino acid/polyamine antiporter